MPLFTCLKDLRKRVYDRLDEGASSYHSENMVMVYLNEALADMHNLVMLEDPWRLARPFYCKPIKTQGIEASEADFALPQDFARLLDCTRPVQRLYLDKIRVLIGANCRPLGLSEAKGAVTPDMLRIEYVPAYAELIDDAELIKLSVIPGHDRWVVNQACILGKLKEEVSVEQLRDENDRLWARILTDLRHRSRVSRAPSIGQVMNSTTGWPSDSQIYVVR